eukprot:CAMPEP_0119289728 /NCGR_PEP_ID=MMETSP1329-20130426/39524_1 /TAXON_ID=114041 /ORGANISM="Genus nov. species nov., Strain RCC1024" /LENGTH=115 /DNA_ID=CAMNT_0007290535 /DNA_START=102 /DNA_END=446 /DNA_ORIENTATION=-
MLKRSRGQGDLASLAVPQFAAASDFPDRKRRRVAAAPAPGHYRTMSFDCTPVVGQRRMAMDAALLSAYMVGADDDSMEEDQPEEPGWTGSWASHQAQMAFLFGGNEADAPVPTPA